MKFAKYLQEEVVPEWRRAYINYKQGKKYLKAIEKALDQLESEALDLHNPQSPSELLDGLANVIVVGDNQSNPQTRQPSSTTFVNVSAQQSQPRPDSPEGTTTPIISRRRGHGRNYSAIIIPPSGSSNVLPQPAPSTTMDDDRSGVGSTLNGGPDTQTTPPLQPSKSASGSSGGFPFGQAARTHSSQLLKNLSRRFTVISPPELNMRARTIQVDDQPIDSVFGQLLPEERTFFNFLDTQLMMVNDFYREKELEAVTKLKVIRQQLYVATEWKRRYDDKLARAEAERGWYMAEWSKVRKGLDNLIRADTAVTDVTIGPMPRDPSKKTLVSGASFPIDGRLSLQGRCNSNVKAPGLRHREGGLHESIDIDSKKMGEEHLAYQEELTLQDEENRRQHLNHKVARTRIKAALYEFYRSLEMLKNYKVLNHTGFAKILKKFDKTAGWKASKAYSNTKLKPAYFMTSGITQDLITETEDLFIETFEKGHRRRGMAKLRIPNSKSQTHHVTSTRIGLYMGLAAPLMVQALQAAFSEEREAEVPYWDGLLLVYAGLFLTILFACLFGINLYVWAKSRINYKFIFEFDPRDNLDFHEYFELPMFLLLLLTLAVYLDFGSKMTAHVATAYWPLILMAIAVFILFLPLPVAHFTARRWFISSIGRILASGYYRVEFRDFFLADEMNSLSYSIEQFEFAMCAYSQQWDDLAHTCQTSHMWITPFVTSLPAWFRFLQCLRRYRDTLEWFPHLLNAGKYTSSLVNLFVYFSFRHYGGSKLKAAYIVMSTFTSFYTFAWDVYMDWGLFRIGKHGGAAHGHPFLRPELVYSRIWVYYLAIVLDFLGRFSWVVRLIPMNINVYLLSFLLALVEVLRRWQWNFFRLENEHLNNCGQFRAIKDIPLPFHIHVEGETDDEEEEEEVEDEQDDERRSTRPANGSQAEQGPTRTSLYRSSSHRSHSLAAEEGVDLFDMSRGASSRFSIHSGLSRRGSQGVGSSPPVDPPSGLARSNSFVDAAVAEAGFKDAQREAVEMETKTNKFYDRRDFDSKIIDADSDLWRRRGRSMTGSNSMHGLAGQGLEGAATSGGGGGPASNSPYLGGGAIDRRSRSQVVPRRKASIGTRMRSSIFGRREDSDDEEDEEEEEFH